MKIISLLLLISINFLNSQTKLGIDVLQEREFDLIKNKKIALLSNFAGRNSQGILTAEILAYDRNVNLDAILAPEHGFFTTVPAGMQVGDDSLFNVPIKSLYGAKKEPNTEYISSLDAVLIDLQDIGVRSYTYLSTIYNTMYIAALSGTPVILLDRPNPIGGIIVDGNVLDTAFKSFVGIIPIPYIHGCTVGELAYMLNEENWLPTHNGKQLKCDLTILTMQNWQRWMQWEDTKLNWFPTSPHIPTIASVRGIATLGAFGELGVLSIGIGTTLPFQYLGSTSFNMDKVIEVTNGLNYSTVKLNPIYYRPFYGMHSGKDVPGVHFTFIPDNNYMPFSVGMEMIFYFKKAYPELFDTTKIPESAKKMFLKVTGGTGIWDAFFNYNEIDVLMKESQKGILEFVKFREKYLLY